MDGEGWDVDMAPMLGAILRVFQDQNGATIPKRVGKPLYRKTQVLEMGKNVPHTGTYSLYSGYLFFLSI